jgi:hypothetical protein
VSGKVRALRAPVPMLRRGMQAGVGMGRTRETAEEKPGPGEGVVVRLPEVGSGREAIESGGRSSLTGQRGASQSGARAMSVEAGAPGAGRGAPTTRELLVRKLEALRIEARAEDGRRGSELRARESAAAPGPQQKTGRAMVTSKASKPGADDAGAEAERLPAKRRAAEAGNPGQRREVETRGAPELRTLTPDPSPTGRGEQERARRRGAFEAEEDLRLELVR